MARAARLAAEGMAQNYRGQGRLQPHSADSDMPPGLPAG